MTDCLSEHNGDYDKPFQEQAIALLSEVSAYAELARLIATRARASLWSNPTLAAVILDDMAHIQGATLDCTNQIANLFGCNPSGEALLRYDSSNAR